MSYAVSVSLDDWLTTFVKLSLSLLVGSLIGIDRQRGHKPAGLRTHMLVSLGATIFVMIPLHVNMSQSVPDALSRTLQGVAAGIGFLGAGEILRDSDRKGNGIKVRGLTSAAAIWVSAALGAAIGAGLYVIGLLGSLFELLVLKTVKRWEQRDRQNEHPTDGADF